MSASTTRNKHSKINNDKEKIDITNDEFERIRVALENEEFRKLFFDYVDEVQDPENRKIYEEEIKQLEKERGVECVFIHPTPGFVVKTAIDGALKCFINIASSKEVERPNNEVSYNSETGEKGLNWSIPLAQTPPRVDLDSKNQECKVFDVVFHPDALHLAKRNDRFRTCVIDTALDGVEREYHVKLDRANLKFPKLDYKGIARPTVIRKLSKNPTSEEQEPHPLEHMYPKKPESDAQPKVLPLKTKVTPQPSFAVPKYVIKHSHDVDMAEYTDELDAKLQVTVPRSLILEIELPLLRSTAECQLDVTEKSVYLLSERQGAKYRLKLDLPYSVDDKAGNARFDTERRRLCITLPVLRKTGSQERDMHDTVRLLSREDSGVELNSNSESPAEEEADGEALDTIVELTKQSDAADCDAFPSTADVTPRKFLQSNLHYQLPAKFDCNILDNVMAFVLRVPNVQPDSIQTVQQARSLHLQFASMGSGYYPTHYAFFVKLVDKIEPQLYIEHAEVDASDDNVVLRLYMNERCEMIKTYLAGPDGDDLNQYAVFGNYSSNDNDDDDDVDNDNDEGSDKESLQITVERTESSLEFTIIPQNNKEDNKQQLQDEKQQQQKKQSKRQRKRNKRSLSESACEDLKAAQDEQHQKTTKDGVLVQLKGATQPMDTLKLPQRKQRSYSECNESSSGSGGTNQRGILKRISRYAPRPSMSDSCSSIDDCSSSYSCSVDAVGFSQSFGGIPEELGDDAGLSESCKKTVRFSDTIVKQTFRLDSSILGQRKKNQKRRICKLRAQQRRVSEGDSADYEEPDHAPGQQTVHKAAHYLKEHNNNNRHNKENNNKMHALHYNGLDISVGNANNNNNNHRRNNNRINEDVKNTMIFEMDDDM